MERTSGSEARRGRATRQRAVRQKSANSGQVLSSAPKNPTPTPEKKPSTPPPRKSPTPIAKKKKSQTDKRNQTIVAFMILIVGFGASAAIGNSDQGLIDVAAVAREKNEKAIAAGQTDLVTIPVQNTTNKVDGGLIGLGDLEPEKSPEPVAATTATTSDETASSTTEVESEEEGEE